MKRKYSFEAILERCGEPCGHYRYLDGMGHCGDSEACVARCGSQKEIKRYAPEGDGNFPFFCPLKKVREK
jgi:hypothetical protein